MENSGSVLENLGSVLENSGSVLENSGCNLENSGSVLENSGSVLENRIDPENVDFPFVFNGFWGCRDRKCGFAICFSMLFGGLI